MVGLHRHILLYLTCLVCFISIIYLIFYQRFPTTLLIVSNSAFKKQVVISDSLKHERKVYAVIPETFHPDFKAPCWYNKDDKPMCLPYFYIAGFPKCGTTDLWYKIIKHPDVIEVCKEPHWWPWRQYGTEKLPTCQKEASKTTNTIGKPQSSIEWYLHFYRTQGAVKEIVKSNRYKSFHPKVFGDASVSTSYGTVGNFFSKYELIDEQFSMTIPKLLYSATPNAKIIIILRDPVDRYYSGYNYSPYGRTKGSPTDFHNQTVEAIDCFKRCLLIHSPYYCVHHLEFCKSHSHGYLDKLPLGMYSIFMKDWLDVFPRNQLYILTLTELRNQPVRTLRDIFQFLELSPYEINTSEKRPVNSRKYPDMLQETRILLQELYRPYEQKLVHILNDTKFSFSSLNFPK
ncbi:carbohydrate sulfotransferase 15-like [Antedon mediterranea]|uniref:carbohydrate sulfotransferase 15-like n=1 Tax=Antedon mediterranea TaxID=105859 RepID=UPI003AF9AC76